MEIDIVIDAGNYTDNYDHFDYQLNTTVCNDATVCPKNFFSEADNTTCCDEHQGKPEIPFRNANQIPEDASDITGWRPTPLLQLRFFADSKSTDYYSSAGKTIPTDGVYVTATYSTYTATTRSSSSLSAGTTTTLNVGPSSTSTSSPSTSPPSSSSDGLSNGAKAGIAIGAVAGAILIALAAYFLWMRRRKAMKKQQLDNQPPAGASYGGYSGVPSQDPTPLYYKSEMPDDTQRMEMDTVSPSERASRTHELPVSSER
ncbi:MAG: hypothetical protein Q9222_002621 [Ikaeria aurantiellina]